MPNTNEQIHTPLNATSSAHSTDNASVNLFNDPTVTEKTSPLQMVLASFLVYFGVDRLAKLSLVSRAWNRALHSTEVMAYLFDEVGITLPAPKANSNNANANSNTTTETDTKPKILNIDDYLTVLKDSMYQRKYLPKELRDGLAETLNVFLRIPRLDLGMRKGDTGYFDFLCREDMGAAIMRGEDRFGRFCIFLCLEFYSNWANNEKITSVTTIFKRDSDPENTTWVSCGDAIQKREGLILPDYFNQDDYVHSRNKLSFWGNYIRRLRNNEPCGKSYGGAYENVANNMRNGESSVKLASFSK